ncbi:Triokinase/FMN cyclase [Armadillidium nasatum]|uniref:Triokinase/FMN cyclase n=1 Tax=Armadillidium nasatum TaxID=96803 RepID=A0A5N5TG93_9CRUS|nr:Triokinase/FMN cyclase [Armadillidium nasatum]
MDQILLTLEEVTKNMGTIGICLSPCSLPGSKAPSFTLKENEMALGLGVHGEAGVRNVEMMSCKETVQLMINHMMDKESESRIDLNHGEEIILLINNLGGTTNLEIGIITNDVVKELTGRGFKIMKIFTGAFVTSQEMAGFFITILKSTRSLYKRNVDLIPLLEMATETPVFVGSGRYDDNDPTPNMELFESIESAPVMRKIPEIDPREGNLLKQCVITSCQTLISIKEKLNEYDRGSGDGDCGSTHSRGASAVLQDLQLFDFQYPADIFQRLAIICGEVMGGTSGGMYSVLFDGISRKLSRNDKFCLKHLWESLQEGIDSVIKYGGAKPGDRTMLDVLIPVSDKLGRYVTIENNISYNDLKEIAERSAQDTKTMKARAGRASYVDQKQLVNPDPGAIAVSKIITSCLSVLSKYRK